MAAPKSIHAEAYHADLGGGDDGNEIRIKLEQSCCTMKSRRWLNRCLGMGFDKPDRIVIHFQRPASVVHYYQQSDAPDAPSIPRSASCFGAEDESISNYFIASAFPRNTTSRRSSNICDSIRKACRLLKCNAA